MLRLTGFYAAAIGVLSVHEATSIQRVHHGGVFIAVKTPIEFQDIAVCDAASGTDYLAAKGFAYVETAVRAQRVAIIGTHFQAGKGERERLVRQQQMQQLRAFIDRRVSPMIDVVILAGDLNVDFGSDEYDDMLSILRAEVPAVTKSNQGWKSWDPSTNTFLQSRVPNASPTHVDYVFLVLEGNGNAVRYAVQRRTVRVLANADGTPFDLSDHHAVLGTVTTTSRRQSTRRDRVISHNINARLPQRTV